MNPRIRLTSAKVEVGVEVEAELGNYHGSHIIDLTQVKVIVKESCQRLG